MGIDNDHARFSDRRLRTRQSPFCKSESGIECPVGGPRLGFLTCKGAQSLLFDFDDGTLEEQLSQVALITQRVSRWCQVNRKCLLTQDESVIQAVINAK